MNASGQEAFLREPHLALLATLMPDGAPHVTPVWHHFEDGRFYILAESNTVKVKNIQRDPRICITVASHRSPYAYVMARGAAGLSKDRTRELLVGMSVRYMGDKKGRAYARTVENLDFLTIALEPSHTVAWSG